MQITLTPDQVLSIIRQAAEATGAPPTAPPATPPARVVTFTRVEGRRLDDVMPAGTPGTITLPVTGHVLSVPQASIGELLLGYAIRVSKQAGVELQTAINMNGALALFQSALKSSGPTPDSWPAMADEFYNREAYNPVSDADKAAQAKQWADAQKLMQQQPPPASTTPAVPQTGPAIEEGSGNAP